ncbi:hypothetical protein TRFO_41388 [Tritrichomonas foetus]|uniref:BTB domain-containing protein n=1 Tax=Tritrichomonas foetus TaxID=1144522 RepID=A0A1J4L4S9_9EUKA|nr:hypothetical protein TRFO_41388 [Tritrichomonas foetus]|eukprot:OHT16988.1 hypothetical protein TRFO_41388 [Tritrichomonas foetus]
MIVSEDFGNVSLFTSFGECDFRIKNHAQVYYCHFQVISSFSRKVSLLSQEGKHPEEIEIFSPTKLKSLQDVIGFFYGESLRVDSFNISELVQLGFLFESSHLIETVVPYYLFLKKRIQVEQELISSFNALSLSTSSSSNNETISSESIEFAALFFEWFLSDFLFLSQIDVNVLNRLLSHPKLRIESEDKLLEKLLNANVSISSLCFVHYEYLTSRGFNLIFDHFSTLPNELFDILKQFFVSPPKNPYINQNQNFNNSQINSKTEIKQEVKGNPRFISPNRLSDYIYEYFSPKIKSKTPPKFEDEILDELTFSISSSIIFDEV